jgi:Protein of unknown function (DUF1572)
MIENYLQSAIQQFTYYKLLGEKTFVQIKEEDLFWKYNDESNSIANIVTHLSGNMVSRWTNFLISDGEKESRNRDEEFKNKVLNKDELMEIWNKGWQCLFNSLSIINSENFNTIIYIRNEPHTIIEAINRQLAHYPYHIGQMVFIGKMVCAVPWQSLSITKGNSKQYNEAKMK